MKKLMTLSFFIILFFLIYSINVLVMSEKSFNLYTYNSAAGQLLQIDPQNGQAVIMHNLSQKNSFADLSSFSNSGSLITIGLKSPNTQLYRINLLSGGIKLIGDTGLNFVEGVEYIPSTGQLFAGGRERPHHTNDSYLFIEINPSDGSIIKQQKTNIGDIDSLAYNPVSGELWAVDNQPNRYARLWTVDLQTGQGTLRKNFTKKELEGYSGLIGISFSPDGQAYGLLHKGTKAPIKEYRLIKIDMGDFSFELLPAENLGQPETLLLTNITSDYPEGWTVENPKIELTVTNIGKKLISNLPIFVKEDEVGNLEIDSDRDGIVQEWEDMAMEYINPYIELDEEENWLIRRNAPHIVLAEEDTEIVVPPLVAELRGSELEKYGGFGLITTATDHVANYVRVHPYPDFYYVTDFSYHSENLPEYIIFRYVVTWSFDYGRFGIMGHKGDHERIFMAWKVIDNKTLRLEWVFTSSHRDPNAHHGVWNAWHSMCNKGDVALTNKKRAHSEVMCSNLHFSNNRLVLYASEDKHAIYPSCDVCENAKLFIDIVGEDCGEGGRFIFDCYNVGEPPGFIDPKIYDLSLDEKNFYTVFPEIDDDIRRFVNKLSSRYRIQIKTGDEDFAGTDAKISIKLFGGDRTSPWYEIYSEPEPPFDITIEHLGTFEKGDIDNIYINSTNLGNLDKIQIKHDNGGVGPGWYISEIWVEDLDTKTIWHCQPNTWLEKVFSPSLFHGELWDDKTNKTFDLELLQ